MIGYDEGMFLTIKHGQVGGNLCCAKSRWCRAEDKGGAGGSNGVSDTLIGLSVVSVTF